MRKVTAWAIIFIVVSYSLHAQMYDPFRKTSKPKLSSGTAGLLPPPPMLPATPAVIPTVVSAVMNDKAFINGAWYRVGDKVNNQEITYIQNHFVSLKEGNRLIVLSVGSNRRVLRTKDVP